MEALTRTLNAEGGRLYVVTDYAAYFQEIQERLAGLSVLHPIDANLKPDRDIATNFEAKYILEGRPIYRAVYEKILS